MMTRVVTSALVVLKVDMGGFQNDGPRITFAGTRCDYCLVIVIVHSGTASLLWLDNV